MTAEARTQTLLAEMAPTLFTTNPDAILLVAADGTIALLNPRAELMFGYHQRALIGQPVEILIPETARDRHRAHRAAYRADPQVRPMGVGLDLTAVHRDGTTFPVEINLSPVVTDHGLFTIATVRRRRPA